MFIGREQELESLSLLLRKPTASMVACRGRRRIGKSTLFREFARRNRTEYIVIEGLGPRKGQTNLDQLKNFGERLCAQTKGPRVYPDSWMEAFNLLGERIDDRRKTVVLLDEISWMGRHEPDFPGLLKNGWDDVLKHHDNLILVICGSVSAWIQKNLLQSTTFGGRFSRSIVLKELPLERCLEFWRGRASRTATRELVDVLSVTGGVPRYLEEIDPSLSADENIRRMCFVPDAPLFQDFNAIFSEVFGDTTLVKADILRKISEGPLTCCELAEKLGIVRGGGLTDNLRELCEAGFISKDEGLNPATGRTAKCVRYRLSDNYTRFFLKYIEPRQSEILSGRFVFASLNSLEGWGADKGYQFENLIVNNYRRLLPHLHIDPAAVKSAAPFAIRGNGDDKKGLQIDLLIQTAKTAYIIEVKRRNRIGGEVIDELQRKLAAFPKHRGITLRTALVYEGELDESVSRCEEIDFLLPVERVLQV